MLLSSISNVPEKEYDYLCNGIIYLIFYTFAKMLKTCFYFAIMVYGV